MRYKKIIKEQLKKFLIEDELKNSPTKEEFEDALLNLSTLNDLEDDQVGYPKNYKNETYLFGGNNYDLYILNRNGLPESGPFEIFIYDGDDNDILIGFIRGTKKDKTISFNLIHIKEDYRGKGIGTDIYEKFLDMGLIIKSDKEITDSTYIVYMKLLSYGYKPIIYDDKRVGLIKKGSE